MHTLTRNWNLVRVIRLLLAFTFLAAGIAKGDTIAFVAAAVLGVQAIFNLGCAGGSCAAATAESAPLSSLNDSVTYEEVK